MIIIENLSKQYRNVNALDNLSLEIKPGEIFGFLGPNGAGKTTTIKLIAGLLKPTSGRVMVGSYDVQLHPLEAKRQMGFIPDQPFVYPKLTGFEFLRFVGDLYQVSRPEQHSKIPELLEMFELTASAGQLLESYSHGMRQKVVLAGVLLHKPAYVFMDEPMVGLDPKSGRLVKEIMGELSSRGVTIFLCTHTLELAERLCHRIGIIQKGRLTHLGTKDELHAQAAKEGSLEDTFLELTGGTEYHELLKYL